MKLRTATWGALACLAGLARGQNVTGLSGTWSTGSGAVLTGPGFADPMNSAKPFNYPTNTGISYSFTDDGYFEEAQYRFNSNGTDPNCATAVVIWQHGTYEVHANGSLTLNPAIWAEDGRIQVQDPCAATTNLLTYYSQFELYNGFTIDIDVNHAQYMLQLYRFDGSLFPRLYLSVRPPTMLPTASLTAAQYSSHFVLHAASADHQATATAQYQQYECLSRLSPDTT